MALRSMMPSLWGRSRLQATGDVDPFRTFYREIDRLFDDFSRNFGIAPMTDEGWPRVAAPRIDVFETDDILRVNAELPGMNADDIDVSISENQVTIRGEKKIEREEKKEAYHVMERGQGAFSRTIPLPFTVDPDRVEASFDKGVLMVTLPKPPEAAEKARKIEVKPAA